MCLKESAGCKKEGLLLLASDSTGIETDRYDYVVWQVKNKKLACKYLHLLCINHNKLVLVTKLKERRGLIKSPSYPHLLYRTNFNIWSQ